MDTQKVAIACQGGGIHGAFTSGVLDAILEHLEEQKAAGPPRFEICGLSGTSAGALNAFLVWYAMMLHEGKPRRNHEARKALEKLWQEFSAQRLGEHVANFLGQCHFSLRRLGVSLKHPSPPRFYDLLMQALPAWNRLETAVTRHPLYPTWDLDLGEVRPEFYDFQALLETCAPHFESVRNSLDEIANYRKTPRLLLGAVDVLSGRFQAFDSFGSGGEQISLDAVQASGTIPGIRRAQRVGDLDGAMENDRLYWDGVFSQNPPIREFMQGGIGKAEKPNEIWVIRINPQTRLSEPLDLPSIEDRRNELSGNISLNQELDFVCEVNEWIEEEIIDPERNYQAVQIYVITMFKETSRELGVESKFQRNAKFVQRLRSEGIARGKMFMRLRREAPTLLREWRHKGALAHEEAIPPEFDAGLQKSMSAPAFA